MNNFIFENTTRVYFGQGCVREYLGCLIHQTGTTVLMAYGGGSIRRNGIYDEVSAILQESGRRVVELPGILPNPTYEKVLEGARLVRRKGIDLILGGWAAARS